MDRIVVGNTQNAVELWTCLSDNEVIEELLNSSNIQTLEKGGVLMRGRNAVLGVERIWSHKHRPNKYVGWEFQLVAVPTSWDKRMWGCYTPMGSWHKHDGTPVTEIPPTMHFEKEVEPVIPQEDYTWAHVAHADNGHCIATTKGDKKCSRKAVDGRYCTQHHPALASNG